MPECQLRLTWAAAAPDWRPMTASWLPGVHPSPNIQADPEVDEIENRAADPEGRLEQAMWQIAPWQGEVVLDLGAGTGFHLERFHHDAQQVIAVEPDGRLRLRAMQRVAGLGLERASVLAGSAERLLLADQSVGSPMPSSPTSSGRGPSRGWPSWPGCCVLGGRRSSSTTTGAPAPCVLAGPLVVVQLG